MFNRIIIPREVLLIELDRRCSFPDCQARSFIPLTKQEAKSYRDLVSSKSLLLSPSFSYLPNERTAINIEMIFSNGIAYDPKTLIDKVRGQVGWR